MLGRGGPLLIKEGPTLQKQYPSYNNNFRMIPGNILGLL